MAMPKNVEAEYLPSWSPLRITASASAFVMQLCRNDLSL